MCSRIILSCFVCLRLASTVWAQQVSEDRKYIIPPNDQYLLTVASQADCPIEVENAKLLFFIGPGSGWGASYRLRNGGTKSLAIQSITLSMWTAMGVGSTWEELTQDAEKALLPGEVITIKEDDRKTKIVPLTDAIRDKMKLRGPLKAVVVLMVEQVKFSDGSFYSDKHTSEALESYFKNIDFIEYKPK